MTKDFKCDTCGEILSPLDFFIKLHIDENYFVKGNFFEYTRYFCNYECLRNYMYQEEMYNQ